MNILKLCLWCSTMYQIVWCFLAFMPSPTPRNSSKISIYSQKRGRTFLNPPLALHTSSSKHNSTKCLVFYPTSVLHSRFPQFLTSTDPPIDSPFKFTIQYYQPYSINPTLQKFQQPFSAFSHPQTPLPPNIHNIIFYPIIITYPL